MKILVLSDDRLPTSWEFPAHGLGKVAVGLAEELQLMGHEVILAGAEETKGAVSGVVVYKDERASEKVWEAVKPELTFDFTHRRELHRKVKAWIVNCVQDREYPAGRFAVFPTQAHMQWHRQNYGQGGMVIHNGIRIPHPLTPSPLNGEGEALTPSPSPSSGEGKQDYYAYMSMFHAPKGPHMAYHAARLAGVELRMAGPVPPNPPKGAKYVGALTGEAKWEFLAGAKALLFPASIEAGAVTCLESMAAGTGILVSAYGGAKENCDPKNSLECADTIDMVAGIEMLEDRRIEFDSEECKTWVKEYRSMREMAQKYLDYAEDVK